MSNAATIGARIPKTEEKEVLQDSQLLDRVADEVSKRVEGEREAIKTIFMVFNMRNVINLSKASDNLLVNDLGGTGKDHVVSSVFHILPDEEKDMRVRISPKVLAYDNDERTNPLGWTKKALYLEDVPNNVLNDDAFKVMVSANPLGANKTSVIVNNVKRDITIRGKPSIVITMAMANPKQELLRRFPILNLTSTINQTRAVMLKQASFAAAGGIGLPDYDPVFKSALGLLKRVRVAVPYAGKAAAAFPTGNVIIRTYFPRFLDYIKSSAALHQHQREKDGKNNVIAAEQDYEVARAMMAATTSNQLMIPLTKVQKDILERFKELEVRGYTFDELYNNMKDVTGERWLRTNVNKLSEYGFVGRDKEHRDGSIKSVDVYTFKDVVKFELPSFQELESSANHSLNANHSQCSNNANQEEKGSPSNLHDLHVVNCEFMPLPYDVFHKCKVCGLSPCRFQAPDGSYICEWCAGEKTNQLSQLPEEDVK